MPTENAPDYYCADCHIYVSPAERKAGADGKIYHRHHHPDAKKRSAELKRQQQRQLVLRFTGEGAQKLYVN